eukprot:TRINITY_DN28077_c0_g1_i1.p1 TRINITY_DN28077_c0_g1~~TRINITY_DN28077_c0_g1_i1.p1  ORF type:complete len:439 (+),score=139.42 TRINITY_DN28077_c0_g1_i1:121-1437(+)
MCIRDRKRKRETEFVEQLARTLLTDEACQSEEITESKLRDIFLGAVAHLPESALRRGLEKRSAAHSRSVFESIQKQFPAEAAAAPPAKKSRGKASGIDFLQESSIAGWLADPKSDSCSTKELYKAAAASGGHPGVVSKLCNSCSDPVAAACHASFLSGSPEATQGLLSALLEHIGRLQESSEVVPTKEYRTRPEWPVFSRCFQLLSVLSGAPGQPTVLHEAAALVCAAYLEWCLKVSPEAAVSHAVLMCGFHLATHPSAMLQMLLDERVPCESAVLAQLVKSVSLPELVDLTTYQRLLKLIARLRSRKAAFAVRTYLNSILGEVQVPEGFSMFLENKQTTREAVAAMSEDAMEELFEQYTEQGDAQADADGGFFIDTGVREATAELGEDQGSEEELDQEDLEELEEEIEAIKPTRRSCLLYTSPSPRDRTRSRMPSSA